MAAALCACFTSNLYLTTMSGWWLSVFIKNLNYFEMNGEHILLLDKIKYRSLNRNKQKQVRCFGVLI